MAKEDSVVASEAREAREDSAAAEVAVVALTGRRPDPFARKSSGATRKSWK
jgi:hypothetical protein